MNIHRSKSLLTTSLLLTLTLFIALGHIPHLFGHGSSKEGCSICEVISLVGQSTTPLLPAIVIHRVLLPQNSDAPIFPNVFSKDLYYLFHSRLDPPAI